MRKWLITLPLLLGAVGAWAGDTPPHKIEPGETLGSIGKKFGYDWRALCTFNKLDSCHVIQAGATIRFPIRGTIVGRPTTELACITLGAAPFNPEHDLERALQGIDLLTTLTPEQKELAKQKVRSDDKATSMEWIGQQIFSEMLYRSTKAGKKVKHVYGKPICTSEQGGQPELMDTYDLGEGVMLSIPRRCGNPSVFIRPTPALLPPEPPEEAPPLPPAPPASAPVVNIPDPDPVPQEPPEAEVVARDYDWDAGLHVGGDKDVRFAGGEGAGYPFIRYFEGGRYALGGGGSFGLWNGGTPDGYRYSGEQAAFGLAQKFSFSNRRDVGVKFPMYGDLWGRGHDASGRYQQKMHASMWCASANYNDASREKAGERWVPEWQIWASLCDPFSQTKSHSWDGKALDASTIPDVKYVLGVGGRVFLSKNLGDTGLAAKLQPFVEVGANKTAPNPTSGHLYGGLRTVDKVWGLGAGLHWSNIGETFGATLTYDLGRHVKLHIQKERWDRMIQRLEALGVATD